MRRARAYGARGPDRTWLALSAGGLAQAVLFGARPMTTYRAVELGAGGFEVGLLAAVFGLAPVALAIPVGRGIDAGHELRLLRLGSLLTVVATIGLIVGGNLWQLAVANLVLGAGIVTTAVSAQGVLARFAGDSELDRIFARFTIAASIGQVIGPVVASAVADHAGSDARYGLTAALGFAVLGVVLTATGRPAAGDRPGDEHGTTEPPVPIVLLMRSPGIVRPILASLALLAALDVFTTFLPLLADRRGVAVSAVGVLLAVRGIASIASRLCLARLTVRLGRTRLLALSMVTSGVLLIVLPFGRSFGALLVVTVLLGVSLGLGQPLTMSLVATAVAPSARGTALSLRMTCNRIGQLSVPLGAGAVSLVLGLPGAFGLAGVLLASASWRMQPTGHEGSSRAGDLT